MDEILKRVKAVLEGKYDFRVEMTPIDFKVIISREMWEEEEYPIVYDREILHLDVPQMCRNEIEGGKFGKCVPMDEWDYGFDHELIDIISKIMAVLEENKEYIDILIRLCNKES